MLWFSGARTHKLGPTDGITTLVVLLGMWM
jgi:hypothetical protein